MSNSLDAFTTARIDYGRTLLSYLRANLFMAKTVSRKYSPEGNVRGGTVRVPDLTVPPVQFRTKHTDITWSDSASNYVDVILDREANVPMVLDSLDAVISDIDHREQMAQRGAIRVAEAVETDLCALYYAIPNVVGSAASAAWSDTAKATAAVTALDTLKAPITPRFGALSPAAKGSALGNAAFTQYNTAGAASTLVSGELGERFGIQWGLCHGILTHRTADGTTDWGTPLVNNAGGYPIGTTSFSVKGLATTGALKKGDAFTLGGYNYSLAADATAAGGIATITIAQPYGLRTAVVDSQAITVSAEGIKKGVQQIVFCPEAFAFATAPMNDDRPGTQSSLITDEQTGLSIRVTYAYNLTKKRHEFLTELLFGVKVVRPELAVRMVSNA